MSAFFSIYSLRGLRFVLAALAYTATASAASITLISQSGGQFTYGLTLNVQEAVNFNPGQQIALTGLAEITSAFPGGFFDPPFTASFTPTTATFTNTSGALNVFINNTNDVLTFGTLSVRSGSSSFGLIDYRIANGTAPAFTGTVFGPVTLAAAIPEPASFSLFGLGTAGLAVWKLCHRRRNAGYAARQD